MVKFSFDTIWPLLSAILTLLLALQTYRLGRANALLNLPYIEPQKPRNSSAPRLGGEHAEKWHIEKVIIRKPRDACFLDQQAAYDPQTGAVVLGIAIEAGRQKIDPSGTLYVRSNSWPVELSFIIALKSSPKVKRSLRVEWCE